MLTPPGSLNGSTVTLEGLGAALNAARAHGLVVELLVVKHSLSSCAKALRIIKLTA